MAGGTIVQRFIEASVAELDHSHMNQELFGYFRLSRYDSFG